MQLFQGMLLVRTSNTITFLIPNNHIDFVLIALQVFSNHLRGGWTKSHV
jgi:hypothetical protein